MPLENLNFSTPSSMRHPRRSRILYIGLACGAAVFMAAWTLPTRADLSDALGGLGDAVGGPVGDVVGGVGDALNGASNGGDGGVGDAVGGLTGGGSVGGALDDVVDGVGDVLNGGGSTGGGGNGGNDGNDGTDGDGTDGNDGNDGNDGADGNDGNNDDTMPEFPGRDVATMNGNNRRCAAGGNSSTFNGFRAVSSSGAQLGVIHDAIVNTNAQIVRVRFLASGGLTGGSACVEVAGAGIAANQATGVVALPVSQSRLANAATR